MTSRSGLDGHFPRGEGRWYSRQRQACLQSPFLWQEMCLESEDWAKLEKVSEEVKEIGFSLLDPRKP